MRTMPKMGALIATALGLATQARAADDWQMGAGDDWRQTLAAARAEEPLALAAGPDMVKPIGDAFTRDTGLKINVLGGAAIDMSSRAARETRAKQLTIDLVLGGPNDIFFIKETGLAEPIAPQLILPTVTGSKYWRDGAIRWNDNTRMYLLQGAEYVNAQPFINKNTRGATAKTWKDMLKPEFTGKIIAHDPRIAGSGQFAASYLASLFGLDFIKQFYGGQKVQLAANARQATESVARGVHWIAVGGSPTDFESFRQAGVNTLMVGNMEDGPGASVGGFSVIWQPKGNPHPAAAKVFLNWYASVRGQEAYQIAKQTPSRRTDTDLSAISDYLLLKPGVKYLDGYTEDFYVGIRPNLIKTIIEAVGGG